MATTKTLLTAEQLAGMPDDGRRLELVKGELVEMPPTGGDHGEASFNIAMLLGIFIKEHHAGKGYGAETGFVISHDPDTVRAPDVAFISRERLQAGPQQGFVTTIPDLVGEVVSPSDTAPTVQAKVEDWLSVGVRIVWVVYPNTRSVVVYQPDMTARVLTYGDTLAGDPVLPGFACKVSELFS
ncbi:MAG: Uma2 family endonuclease [Chloroflexi bacterium]|nr:Uma2 family endonuclease [Chloroflexota bacterium]